MTKSEVEKAKKRVLIAKDVIKLLDLKKIKSVRGLYLNLNGEDTKDSNAPVEKVLKKKKSCQVCALGSLFYAHVNRFNKVKVKNLRNEYYDARWNHPNNQFEATQFNICKPLHSYFSQEQLLLIEDYFEENNIYSSTVNDYIPAKKMSIRAIMENIIKNNGTFIPNGSLNSK